MTLCTNYLIVYRYSKYDSDVISEYNRKQIFVSNKERISNHYILNKLSSID